MYKRQPQSSDRSDLSVEDFTAQINVIRQLLRAAIGGVWQLIRRNIVLVLVLSVGLGGMLGYMQYISKPVYATGMTVAFKLLNKKMYADMLGKLNALAREKNFELLGASLGISVEQAETIGSIQTFNMRGDDLALDLANDSEPITIAVETTDSELLPVLRDGIIRYLNASPFVQEQIALQNTTLDAKLEHFGVQRAWIDSVKAVYTRSLEGNSDAPSLSLSELLARSNEVFSSIEELETAKMLNRNIIVMHDFSPTLKDPTSSPVKKGIVGAVIGLVLALGIGFVRG